MWDIDTSSRWLRGHTSDIQDEPTASNANQATEEIWWETDELKIPKLSVFSCPEINKETYTFSKCQWRENNLMKQYSGGVRCQSGFTDQW